MVPCSRREAEQYIEGGWVRVDGVVIEEPHFRVSGERVELDPAASTATAEPVTFLFHKPAGLAYEDAIALLTPANRAVDDPSGIRRVKRHLIGLRALMTIGPQSSGLAVFSQDGRVIRKLTEDAGLIEQELVAEVEGTITEAGLARLCQGLVWQNQPLPPIKVSWQSEKRLRFATKGIAPSQIEWMCGQVGLRLGALKRIRIGRVPMAGLSPGQWRCLEAGERF